MAAARRLGFVRILDHPPKAFGGLYHYAEFGCNPYVSFDNVQVSVENAYSRPQNGVRCLVG